MKKIIQILMLSMVAFLPALSQTQNGETSYSPFSIDSKEYFVSTPEQLQELSLLVESGRDFFGKTIYITNDIDISEYTWTPIGTIYKPFSGNIDGIGAKITIGKIKSGDLGGFIGILSNGSVRNLTISIKAKQENIHTIGAIASVINKNSTIENCAHVEPLHTSNAQNVGGIVGVSFGKIKSCVNYGNIVNNNSKKNKIGGVVAIATNTITQSHNYGNIEGTNIIGGILGSTTEESSVINIEECFNFGKINVRSNCRDSENTYAGGIAGILNNMKISKSANKSTINAYNYKEVKSNTIATTYASGLVAYGYGKISDSYNTGNIQSRCMTTAPDNEVCKAISCVGGLIGYSSGNIVSDISNSYSAGQIYLYGNSTYRTIFNYGGIIGDFASFMPTLKLCYSLENNYHTECPNQALLTEQKRQVGIFITEEDLSSANFLKKTENLLTGLNNNTSFIQDIQGSNHGYPLIQTVQTLGFRKMGNTEIQVNGFTDETAVEKGFYVWIEGLEEFVAEVQAENDFTYQWNGLEKGKKHFYQAYTKNHDNVITKGEIVEFIIPE